MKLQELRRYLSHGLWPMAIASSVFLAACGGSGGGGGSTQTAGIGGTGIVAGKVTGFGSIFVNGKKFETDQSRFIVDGENFPDQSSANLQVGMYVQLRVETQNGNLGTEALEVFYDDEVQGPVAATPVSSPDGTQKTFTVFGQTITIDDIGTLFKAAPAKPNFSFDTISANDVVEISGFRTSTNTVTATYVEFKEFLDPGNSEVELRGIVTGYIPGSPETFGIVSAPGITITANGSEIRDPQSLVLQNGLFVEIEGTYVNATSVLATEIEEEDEDFGEDIDEISLQGIVSDIASGISNFLLDNQRVDASGIPGLTLTDGMNIEVEGEIVNGKLIADEVEIEEEETKLRSYVDTVGVNSFEVYYPATSGPTTITVHVDSQTYFEDATGTATPPFSIGDLTPGLVDYVRIEGTEVANDEVLATIVKRTNPEDKLELEGEVDGFNLVGGNGTITILGIQYQLDSVITSYEPDPPDIQTGDFVEIEDDDDPFPNEADGIADEVEEE